MIIQTNIFVCDFCGKIESETEEVSLYSDPLVALGGWDVIRKADSEESKLACPECRQPVNADKMTRYDLGIAEWKDVD